MATRDSAVKIADGDQLNDGYFNDTAAIITIEAGETIAAGNIVYIKKSDGKIYVSGTGTADDIRADGIALSAGDAAADITVQTRGVYTTTGLTDKDEYYLGSAGALSATASGVRIGIALSTTQLFISIIQDDRDAPGTVKAWHEDLTGMPSNMITAFWLACDGAAISDAESPFNGQNLPDLNTTQRFLRGSATTGTTAGADTHVHNVPAATSIEGGAVGDVQTVGATGNSDAGSTLPAHMTVKWIFKIK